MPPFILISPATRGLSLALTRHYLRTTSLPIFTTFRPNPPNSSGSGPDGPRTPESVREDILGPLRDIDPARLHLLPLDLTSEESIASAADALGRALPQLPGPDAPSYIRTAFFTGGVLHPERQPADLALDHILETFRLNVVCHLLLIKHFSRFLPPASASTSAPSDPLTLAKWVHVSARVGSISDNRIGGWYSYRASKAALNQVIRTFDLHLQAKKLHAMAVGVHPGTVKTDLSERFWRSVSAEKLFSPEYSAAKLAEVVDGLRADQRGKVWDWKGEEVEP
ncbi:NAD(P)-binding protein [Ganoderma leucocontextum]|nr:NAD(P)-binding protein [Ganoderma leucocontextum]